MRIHADVHQQILNGSAVVVKGWMKWYTERASHVNRDQQAVLSPLYKSVLWQLVLVLLKSTNTNWWNLVPTRTHVLDFGVQNEVARLPINKKLIFSMPFIKSIGLTYIMKPRATQSRECPPHNHHDNRSDNCQGEGWFGGTSVSYRMMERGIEDTKMELP